MDPSTGCLCTEPLLVFSNQVSDYPTEPFHSTTPASHCLYMLARREEEGYDHMPTAASAVRNRYHSQRSVSIQVSPLPASPTHIHHNPKAKLTALLFPDLFLSVFAAACSGRLTALLLR